MAVHNFAPLTTIKTKITESVYQVRFEIPDHIKFEFKPGQFMSVLVGRNIRRSYSIGNIASEGNYLETFVDVTPGGPGSQFFVALEAGQPAQILAPLGQFVYRPTEDRPAHFYATGTGIVPLIAMIKHALIELGSQRQIDLYLGFRFEADIFYTDELNELATKYQNFKYHLFVSRPTEQWQGLRGYINQFIESQLHDNVDAYICGGTHMIQDTAAKLEKAGIVTEQIHYEKYY